MYQGIPKLKAGTWNNSKEEKSFIRQQICYKKKEVRI